MVDVNNYNFNILTAKTVKPEESFINAYISECFESESVMSEAHRMCSVLDTKYKKADLNKVTTEQFQHQNTEECNQLLSL